MRARSPQRTHLCVQSSVAWDDGVDGPGSGQYGSVTPPNSEAAGHVQHFSAPPAFDHTEAGEYKQATPRTGWRTGEIGEERADQAPSDPRMSVKGFEMDRTCGEAGAPSVKRPRYSPALPPGWDMQVDEATQRVCYVDRNTGSATWLPPTVCISCGTVSCVDDARFCGECGLSLAASGKPLI